MSVSQSPDVALVRGRQPEASKQGLSITHAIAAQTCGSQALWMGLVAIPPGTRGNAHLHESHETALHFLQGEGEMWYGAQLQERISFTAGDFLYIPAGMPHMPVNTSQTATVLVVAARTDPNEQESVVLLPELDALVP